MKAGVSRPALRLGIISIAAHSQSHRSGKPSPASKMSCPSRERRGVDGVKEGVNARLKVCDVSRCEAAANTACCDTAAEPFPVKG